VVTATPEDVATESDDIGNTNLLGRQKIEEATVTLHCLISREQRCSDNSAQDNSARTFQRTVYGIILLDNLALSQQYLSSIPLLFQQYFFINSASFSAIFFINPASISAIFLHQFRFLFSNIFHQSRFYFSNFFY